MIEAVPARGGRRVGTVALALVLVVASLTVATFIVVQRSKAAFNATTTNGSNSWSAGSVSLSDDDGARVMFNVSGMKPGDTSTRCIAVTYGGSLTANVHLYGSVAGTGLAPYLTTTVQVGSGGSFADCTGFTPASTVYSGTLSSLASTHSNYATGMTGFDGATSAAVKAYRFSLTLVDDNNAQGKNATATFTWEAQNT